MVAAVLPLLLGGCASRRASAPAVVPEPAPGRAVYHTQARVDPATAVLEVRASLRFVASESTARQVGLLLNRGFELRGVRGPAVRSYRSAPSEFSPLWTLVTVELDESVAPGDAVTLDISYAGRPEFPSDNINGISPEWVELGLDSQWHPTFSSFEQQLTGVVRLVLPSTWEVVASGEVTREQDGHMIRNTIPQVDVAFSAAPRFTHTRSENLTVYSRQAAPRTVSAVVEAAESCTRYLNARYGGRERLPAGRIVLADRQGPGYARKNYIVLSEVNPEDSVGLYRYLCHELGHFWTRTAGAFSPHHWMTEAFAEYTAARYLRERFGQAAFDRLVDQWEQAGRAHGPVWTPETTRRPTFFLMYRRAPYLLSLLEARIGMQAFDRFLERYMTEEVRTTPELLEQLEAVAGGEAAAWFREQLVSRPSDAG